MPLDFEVRKYLPAGSNHSEKINSGRIASTGFVKIPEPKGHIWFGGDNNPQVQIAIEGFEATTTVLPPSVAALAAIPLVIGGQPLKDKTAYTIDLVFAPPESLQT